MKYKDYGAIYKIFRNIPLDQLNEIAKAYTRQFEPCRKFDNVALATVIALARSDGLTEDEINGQIINAGWYPSTEGGAT